jgi:hypothetical protein
MTQGSCDGANSGILMLCRETLCKFALVQAVRDGGRALLGRLGFRSRESATAALPRLLTLFTRADFLPQVELTRSQRPWKTPGPGATYAFGRRPLSRASRPFIWPIWKSSKGSILRVCQAAPERPLFAHSGRARSTLSRRSQSRQGTWSC